MYRILIAMLLFAFVPSALAESFDEPALWERIDTALTDGRYDELEKLATALGDLEIRSAGGAPKLHDYFRVLRFGADTPCACDDAHFYRRTELLRDWLDANPQSVNAKLALAATWVDYAGSARGNGYIGDVSEEQWELVHERLEAAVPLLRGVEASENPYAAYALLNFMRLAGAPRQSIDAVFQEGIESFPTYYPLYGNYAELLLRRWYGREGDLAELLTSRVAGKGDSVEVATAYSFMIERVAVSLSRDVFFPETRQSWIDIQRAFSIRERAYGLNSYQWNVIFFMAAGIGDKETAADALSHIGDNWSDYVWDTKEIFDDNVRWIRSLPDRRW